MDLNNVQTTIFDIVSECVKALPVLVGSAAALIASIAAIKGINAWKREFQGKKKIEHAEEALILFY